LANTPKVIGSIKRYMGRDLTRFGNRQAEEDAIWEAQERLPTKQQSSWSMTGLSWMSRRRS